MSSRGRTRNPRDLEAWRRAPMPKTPEEQPTVEDEVLRQLVRENPRGPDEGAGSYAQRIAALAGYGDREPGEDG
jgi:hypothetical protein